MTKILHRWLRNPARKPVEVGSFLRLFTTGFYTSQVVVWDFFQQVWPTLSNPHLNLSYRTQRMRNTMHPALHQMHQASCDVSNWDSFPNSGFVRNYGLFKLKKKVLFLNDPKRQISRNIFLNSFEWIDVVLHSHESPAESSIQQYFFLTSKYTKTNESCGIAKVLKDAPAVYKGENSCWKIPENTPGNH